MDEINVTSAQYVEDENGNNVTITAVIDGITSTVPISVGNRHYDAIKAKHDDADDSFTIQDAS
jgi:hypothetical protein